jgi:hypothetical protein
MGNFLHDFLLSSDEYRLDRSLRLSPAYAGMTGGCGNDEVFAGVTGCSIGMTGLFSGSVGKFMFLFLQKTDTGQNR